jgi:hypothetical protein
MDIKIPLLSILSAALVFLALLSGGRAELYSVEVGWSISAEESSVTIDPIFVIATDQLRSNGACVGGAIFLNRDIFAWGENDIHHVLLHELRHADQFRALGLWLYPASFILPIEPITIDWSDSNVELDEMWNPLQVSQHFISFRILPS